MSFDSAELEEFRKQFDLFDADRNGSITALELQSALKAVGEHVCDERTCCIMLIQLTT